MDIVDGDNAAEIAGEQRRLMMSLLASERANERIERAGQGTFSPSFPLCIAIPIPILFSSLGTASTPSYHLCRFANQVNSINSPNFNEN